MPAFLVRLNCATIPLKGEFDKTWAGLNSASAFAKPPALGRSAPPPPFGLFVRRRNRAAMVRQQRAVRTLV